MAFNARLKRRKRMIRRKRRGRRRAGKFEMVRRILHNNIWFIQRFLINK